VLLRPPGEALPHRGRCEPHDLSQHVVLRTKLEQPARTSSGAGPPPRRTTSALRTPAVQP
jgi:hypothetical protein